jgi:hypothetical protein
VSRSRLAVAAVVLVTALAACAAPAVALPMTPVDASPLAANGFESPSCTSAALAAQLSPAERTNCSVSGVAVAPVPLSNYSVDVGIPAGFSASLTEDIDSIVQDLLLTPVWTAVVWFVHVVLIALEWCYSIDLLAPATLQRAAAVLGGARRVFTDPWLGLALAIAAAGFAWQGLVRRRVLDTLGQAAVLALMVACGLWIMADPAGTVGAVGGMADRAALATVAAAATGDPSQPVASVDAAFGSVFDTAITGPWCYLEFGDVSWCRDPSALDPRLRATAVRLESAYRAEATCSGAVQGLVQCAPGGSALQSQLAGAATALAEARTNGELFLALPPESLARTALTGQTVVPTLYGTLCGGKDPTGCTAPTTPQAEFRTASGTWPRIGGLLLIVAGTLGMLLLLGFIALRLLGAALATLVYLLLAPLAVLAPAFGEAGRAAFRLWLIRLVGATLSKLVYSVALGAALLVVSLLSSLDALGWWTQWLLVSVFWWTAFEQRHRLLSIVMHERGEPIRRAPLATRVFVAGRTVGTSLALGGVAARTVAATGARTVDTVRRVRAHSDQSTLPPQRGGGATDVRDSHRATPNQRESRTQIRSELAAQVDRVQSVESRSAAASGSRTIASLVARRAQLATALTDARGSGDARRLVSLRLRAEHVDAQLAAARREARGGSGRSATSRLLPASRGARRRAIARDLDAAARLAPGTVRGSSRIAAPLAALAGMAPAEYQRSLPVEQRAARLEIERELTRRREMLLALAARQPPAVVGGRESTVFAAVPRRARQFGWRPR